MVERLSHTEKHLPALLAGLADVHDRKDTPQEPTPLFATVSGDRQLHEVMFLMEAALDRLGLGFLQAKRRQSIFLFGEKTSGENHLPLSEISAVAKQQGLALFDADAELARARCSVFDRSRPSPHSRLMFALAEYTRLGLAVPPRLGALVLSLALEELRRLPRSSSRVLIVNFPPTVEHWQAFRHWAGADLIDSVVTQMRGVWQDDGSASSDEDVNEDIHIHIHPAHQRSRETLLAQISAVNSGRRGGGRNAGAVKGSASIATNNRSNNNNTAEGVTEEDWRFRGSQLLRGDVLKFTSGSFDVVMWSSTSMDLEKQVLLNSESYRSLTLPDDLSLAAPNSPSHPNISANAHTPDGVTTAASSTTITNQTNPNNTSTATPALKRPHAFLELSLHLSQVYMQQRQLAAHYLLADPTDPPPSVDVALPNIHSHGHHAHPILSTRLRFAGGKLAYVCCDAVSLCICMLVSPR